MDKSMTDKFIHILKYIKPQSDWVCKHPEELETVKIECRKTETSNKFAFFYTISKTDPTITILLLDYARVTKRARLTIDKQIMDKYGSLLLVMKTLFKIRDVNLLK